MKNRKYLKIVFISIGLYSCSNKESDFLMKNAFNDENSHYTEETFVEDMDVFPQESCDNDLGMNRQLNEIRVDKPNALVLEEKKSKEKFELYGWLTSKFGGVKDFFFKEKSDLGSNDEAFCYSDFSNVHSPRSGFNCNLTKTESCPNFGVNITKKMKMNDKSLPLFLPDFDDLLIDKSSIQTNVHDFDRSDDFCDSENRYCLNSDSVLSLGIVAAATISFVTVAVVLGNENVKSREREKMLLKPFRDVLIDNNATVVGRSLGQEVRIDLSLKNPGDEYKLGTEYLFNLDKIEFSETTNLSCNSINTLTPYMQVLNVGEMVFVDQSLPQNCEIDFSRSSGLKRFSLYNSEIGSDIILPSSLSGLIIDNTTKLSDNINIACENCTEAVIETLNKFKFISSLNYTTTSF